MNTITNRENVTALRANGTPVVYASPSPRHPATRTYAFDLKATCYLG